MRGGPLKGGENRASQQLVPRYLFILNPNRNFCVYLVTPFNDKRCRSSWTVRYTTSFLVYLSILFDVLHCKPKLEALSFLADYAAL